MLCYIRYMKKKHKKSPLEVGTGLKIGLEMELFLAANENENLILDQQSRIVPIRYVVDV